MVRGGGGVGWVGEWGGGVFLPSVSDEWLVNAVRPYVT